MDISRLELFFAAANSDNFTQAAEKCNVAQTTMSKYIAQLEDELGVRLFYRTTRECSLTEAGHKFYNGAKELRKDYESLRKQLTDVTENELDIGLYGEFIDLSVLTEFSNAHPEIRLKVSFDTKENMYDQLRRRKIHAVLIPDILISGSMRNPTIKSIDIVTGEPCLYCSVEAINQYGSPSAVIEHLPYITKAVESDYHDYSRRILKDVFNAEFRDIVTVESRARQQLLIELSQGFGIMLRSEIEQTGNIYSFPLTGVFNETLQLHYSVKHVPDILRTFIDFVQNTSLYTQSS